MAERIRITVSDQGQINWSRGGVGMSTKAFVETYPCKALRYLADGGTSTDLGEAVLSTIGGRGNLIEFNNKHLCGIEENLLQQT